MSENPKFWFLTKLVCDQYQDQGETFICPWIETFENIYKSTVLIVGEEKEEKLRDYFNKIILATAALTI